MENRLLRKNIFTNPSQHESVPDHPIPSSQPSQSYQPPVDVEKIATEAAARGATAALAAQERLRQQYQEEDGAISWSPKTERDIAKTLFGTVIKKMSDQVLAPPEDPLRSVITQISSLQELMNILRGGAAGNVGSGERSYVDKFLNSQFALGLGQGFGSNPKQVIESLGSLLGPKQSQDLALAAQNYLAQHGGPQQTNSQSPNPPNLVPQNPQHNPASASSVPSSPQSSGQSGQSGSTGVSTGTGAGQVAPNENRDVLLSLDPNNPDHIAAYAETQGGLPVDIARKMLMIHQDAFHKQIEQELKTVDQINQISQQKPISRQNQNDPFVDKIPISQPISQVNPIPANNYSINNPVPIPSANYPVNDPPITSPPVQSAQSPPIQTSTTNNHIQDAILQIAQTMDTMMTRMENLNNHVFNLQTELNDIRTVNQSKQIQKDTEEINHDENTNIDIKWHDDVILSKVESVELPVEQPLSVESPVEMKVEVEQPLSLVEQPLSLVEQPLSVESPVEMKVEVEQPLSVESPVEMKVEVEQPLSVELSKVEQSLPIEDSEFIEITGNEEEANSTNNIELISEDDIKTENVETNKETIDMQNQNTYKVGYRFAKKEEKIGRKLSKGEKLDKRIIKGKAYQVSIEGNTIKEIYDEQKELLIPLEKFFTDKENK